MMMRKLNLGRKREGLHIISAVTFFQQCEVSQVLLLKVDTKLGLTSFYDQLLA